MSTYVIRAAADPDVSNGWTNATDFVSAPVGSDVYTHGVSDGISTITPSTVNTLAEIHFPGDPTLILLNGSTPVDFAGLPIGFTPLTAQVDVYWLTQGPLPPYVFSFMLEFDRTTQSGNLYPGAAGFVANSFVFPGAVPSILDLITKGFGASYSTNAPVADLTGVEIDFLQISGTYGLLAFLYYSNPFTNHYRYANPIPPGGNWVLVPKFVPTVVAISPNVGSTSGGDFITITGTFFDDSAALSTTIGGVAITGGIVVNSNTITGFTGAHAAGVVDVVVINQDGSSSTLVGGFTYVVPQWWTFPPGNWWFGGPPPPYPTFPVPTVVPPTVWVPPSSAPPTDTKGWYWSLNGFAGASFLALSPGNPKHPRAWDKVVAFATGNSAHLGGLPCATYRNHIIYAGDDYSIGTTAPTVRIFDGITDRLLLSMPPIATTTTPPIAIMTMLLVGDILYITTLDSGTTHANFAGRVFALDLIYQTVTQIGAGFSSGEVPYAMAYHQDRLWLGTNHSDGSQGSVYFFRPNIDEAWTIDSGLISTPAAPTELPYAGTAGSTNISYTLVARGSAGTTVASAALTITDANETQDTTNYARITWTGVTGVASYDVYRTATTGLPSTVGKIANVVNSPGTLTLADTGLTGDGTTSPVSNTTSNQITGGVCSMLSFGGKLFIGCDQVAGTYAKVYTRSPLGAYATADTGSGGGAAHVNNGWLSMAVFNNILYMAYWNGTSPAVARVDSITPITIAVLAYTGTGDTLTPYIAMFVANAGVPLVPSLYILGGKFGLQASLVTTPDGVTFTDESAELNTIATETALPIFGSIGL